MINKVEYLKESKEYSITLIIKRFSNVRFLQFYPMYLLWKKLKIALKKIKNGFEKYNRIIEKAIFLALKSENLTLSSGN